VGQFVYVIRKRIRVSPEQAIFMFVRNVLPPTGEPSLQLLQAHADYDGNPHSGLNPVPVFCSGVDGRCVCGPQGRRQLFVHHLQVLLGVGV
jgi:hypothetical protein